MALYTDRPKWLAKAFKKRLTKAGSFAAADRVFSALLKGAQGLPNKRDPKETRPVSWPEEDSDQA